MSLGSRIADYFSTSEMKSSNTSRLQARVSNLLANQHAFSHEQASFCMQIFYMVYISSFN